MGRRSAEAPERLARPCLLEYDYHNLSAERSVPSSISRLLLRIRLPGPVSKLHLTAIRVLSIKLACPTRTGVPRRYIHCGEVTVRTMRRPRWRCHCMRVHFSMGPRTLRGGVG